MCFFFLNFAIMHSLSDICLSGPQESMSKSIVCTPQMPMNYMIVKLVPRIQSHPILSHIQWVGRRVALVFNNLTPIFKDLLGSGIIPVVSA